MNRSINQSFIHSVQLINPIYNQPINHTINQSNHSINQLHRPSVSQSTTQAHLEHITGYHNLLLYAGAVGTGRVCGGGVGGGWWGSKLYNTVVSRALAQIHPHSNATNHPPLQTCLSPLPPPSKRAHLPSPSKHTYLHPLNIHTFLPPLNMHTFLPPLNIHTSTSKHIHLSPPLNMHTSPL